MHQSLPVGNPTVAFGEVPFGFDHPRIFVFLRVVASTLVPPYRGVVFKPLSKPFEVKLRGIQVVNSVDVLRMSYY